MKSLPKAKNSPTASHSMVFGPNSLNNLSSQSLSPKPKLHQMPGCSERRMVCSFSLRCSLTRRVLRAIGIEFYTLRVHVLWPQSTYMGTTLRPKSKVYTSWVHGPLGTSKLQGFGGGFGLRVERCRPIGPEVGPFGGSYLESYKVIPRKGLLRGPWAEFSSGFVP